MTGRGREWPLDWQLAVAGAVAVLIVAGYLGVLAQTGREDPTGGLQPVRPPSDEVLADATAFVREQGAIAEINGGQAWEASRRAYRRVPERGDLVTFVASWDEPVTHERTWSSLQCQYTWLVEETAAWENVTAVRVTIDLQAGELVELHVVEKGPESGAPQRVDGGDDEERLHEIVIRDVATGEELEGQTRQAQRSGEVTCPEGLGDEEPE